MSIPLPTNFAAPSAARADSGFGSLESRQALEAAGGAGNRGFINNFAAEGASVSAPEINGPAWNPKLLLVAAAAFGAVLLIVAWRRR